MNSFIFPEDLDLLSRRQAELPRPAPKHIQSAPAVPTHHPETAPAVAPKRARPVPIIVPSTVDFNAYLNANKPKDDIVVSVTRFSLDERSPRLQQQRAEQQKRPNNLTRWMSTSMTKAEKEERDMMRMARQDAHLAPPQRPTHMRKPSREERQRASQRNQLAPLHEEHRDRSRSPADYGVAHLMF